MIGPWRWSAAPRRSLASPPRSRSRGAAAGARWFCAAPRASARPRWWRRASGGPTASGCCGARCQETEAGLPFAALADLLRPVLDHLPAVPAPQRAALRAALALGPPAAPDRFAAYAAALSLLGVVATDSPVLVVVDDAQWLDAPSREALVFCARRIEDEPVAMLAASRELAPERVDVPGLTEVELGPLEPADAKALLAPDDPRGPAGAQRGGGGPGGRRGQPAGARRAAGAPWAPTSAPAARRCRNRCGPARRSPAPTAGASRASRIRHGAP